MEKIFSLRKTILLIFIISLLVSLISIISYPRWSSNINSLMSLIGLVFIGTVTVISGIVTIYARFSDEYKKFERSKKAFSRVTADSERVLKPKLRGIPRILARQEVSLIQDLLSNGQPVLLTGTAGTGKSGIAVELIDRARRNKKMPLLLDSRRLIQINNLSDLREFFDVDEPILEAVERISGDTGILIVADQLDNIVSSPACNVLVDFLINCVGFEGSQVVVISRRSESNERGALNPLFDAEFREVNSRSLERETIIEVLRTVGVNEVSDSIIDLASNLLNLDLICEIVKTSSVRDIDNIQDEIQLWESYRVTIRDRENQGGINGDEFIYEAVRLAKLGLRSLDRAFFIDFPPNQLHNRLISNQILTKVSGRKYQFSTEKLQDYLFAWDACDQLYTVEQVYQEVDPLHVRNIILWMREIYEQRGSPVYEAFLEEVLSG